MRNAARITFIVNRAVGEADLRWRLTTSWAALFSRLVVDARRRIGRTRATIARMWRNWQTRWLQVPVGATPWRFESSHPQSRETLFSGEQVRALGSGSDEDYSQSYYRWALERGSTNLETGTNPGERPPPCTSRTPHRYKHTRLERNVKSRTAYALGPGTTHSRTAASWIT